MRIVYDDLGAGTPVVLCHGLAAAGAQLLEDGRQLAAQGYRVLVPDLRGHGRSGKPAAMTRESFSIARMAADQLELLDHAGTGPVHWVGNSLGGILALALLPEHAQRFLTLATFGTVYRLQLPRWSGRLFPLTYAVLGRRLTAALTARATTPHAGPRALIARLVADFDPQVGQLIVENLARYDLTAAARTAMLPMLLVRGSRDRAVNAALRPSLAPVLAGGRLTVVDLPDAGHCANLDAGAALRRELLAFWRAHEAARARESS